MPDEAKTEYASLADLKADHPYLQKWIDDMVKDRLDRDRRSRGSSEEAVKALEQENAALSEKLMLAEKEKIVLKKKSDERDGFEKDAQTWKSQHTRYLAEAALRRQAEAAGVVPGAVDLFVKAILADGEIDLTDGNITIKHNGKPLDDAAMKAMISDDIRRADVPSGAGSGGNQNLRQTSAIRMSVDAAKEAVRSGDYSRMSKADKEACMSALEGAVKGQ